MSEGAVTIRTRNFLRNPLLKRRQFVVDVVHPGRPSVAKKDIRDKLAKMYKVKDAQSVMLFGFRLDYGGGRSSGFGLIYDSLEQLKKYEPKYRQNREGFLKRETTGRKQRKERRNRAKKVRGTRKIKAAASAKK